MKPSLLVLLLVTMIPFRTEGGQWWQGRGLDGGPRERRHGRDRHDDLAVAPDMRAGAHRAVVHLPGPVAM